MHQTNVDRALAALEEQHADDPERATALHLTRRFKASWLELGEALTDVKRNKTWERWGYDSFETYTKTELKLRADTVEKLTGSYMFLHKRAPEVLQRDPLEALPTYQAIDYLRRVEEKAAEDDSIPAETLVDVRKQILDDGVPVAKVARLYNDTLFPVSENEKRESNRKALKATAAKLRDLLADTSAVPKRLASTVGEALDELLDELNGEAKAA
jgi:CRISPR/Cas system CSM-associated protein Csm2 small subunit